MAETNYSFSKKITSNQKSPKTQDGEFKEIASSEEEINDEKLKDIYEELFYEIPKKGEESHESILVQSNEALYPEVNENLDNDIKYLEQELLEKNNEYLNKNLPELLQIHPIFPNGIFIQEGNINSNTPIDPESTIWFVQEGHRRALLGSNKEFWTQLIRKAIGDKVTDPLGNPISLAPPIIKYSTPEDIMSMKEGQDIATGTDISITPIIAKEVQTALFSTLKIALHCKGVERWYEFEPGEEPAAGSTGWQREGYWYLDGEGHCEMVYETDEDPGYEYNPKITTKIWKGGTWIGTTISRDPLLYGGQDPLSQAFYSQPPNVEYKTRPNMGAGQSFEYIEEWGEGKKFPAITNIKAGSHIFVSINSPETSTEGTNLSTAGGTGNEPNNYAQLNGINQYAPQIDPPAGQLNILNNYYYKESYYGTQMIQRDCYGPLADECYGSFGQPNSLQELLSDPGQNYYSLTIQTSYRSDNGDKEWPGGDRGKRGDIGGGGGYTPKVYGQPILKVGGKGSNPWTYSVFLGGYRRDDGFRDYAVFYDLEYGDFWRIRDVDLKQDNSKDSVKGYHDYQGRVFQWFRPTFYNHMYNQPAELPSNDPNYVARHINNPKIYFPGIYAQELNWWWSDLDLYMCSMDHHWGCSGLNDIETWQIQNQSMLHTDYTTGTISFNPPTQISGRGNSNFTIGQMREIIEGI
jgi:hypothetical protein